MPSATTFASWQRHKNKQLTTLVGQKNCLLQETSRQYALLWLNGARYRGKDILPYITKIVQSLEAFCPAKLYFLLLNG